MSDLLPIDVGREEPRPHALGGEKSRITDGDYFDRLAQENGDFNPFGSRGWRTLASRFSETAEEEGRVLDVGCGTGHSQQIYSAYASHYVGIDLSAESVRIAAGRHPGLSWIQADALRVPFGDESFDVVAFSSVLHHIPHRETALDEARRVLRPGGLVFAFDPNLLHPAMALFRHPRSPFYISAGVSPNERPLRPNTLRREFAQAGFVSIRQRCQADIPYRAVAPRVINSLLGLYNLADRALEVSGLGRWFGTFVLTSGRKPD